MAMAATTMLSSMTVYYLLVAIIVFASSSSNVFAFTTSTPTTTAIASAKVASRSLLQPQLRQQPPPPLRLPLTPLLATSTSSSPNTDVDDVDVVVISPPGGIGEMTSIEAARLGGAVKWFVISAPTTANAATATTTPSSSKSAAAAAASVKQVSLTAETLAAIEKAGGSLELAGASADSLLLLASQQVPASAENTNGGGSKNSYASSLAAVASWCANSNCIISTYDNGASSSNMNTNMMLMENYLNKSSMEEEKENAKIRAAIRLATKEAVLGMKMQPTTTASGSANDTKKTNVIIAILPTGVEEEEEDILTDKNMNNNNEPSRSGGGLFGIDLFGGAKDINDPVVPTTLMDAIGKHHGDGIIIRYGDLFGAPESSPESSPFMGGPKRDPVLRDMYTMRSVRIDPTIFSTSSSSSSSSSSSPSGMTFKSNRLTVAELVSQLGMGKIDRMISDATSTTSLDITLSSFVGTEKPSDEEWNAEFGRVLSELLSYPSSIVSGGGTQQQQRRLFRAEFASVPSTKRLAEWIATKWAPAVLRSYDIAGIRVGARPVYALLQSSSSSFTTTTNNNDGNDVNVVEIVWQELANFNSVTSGKMIIEVGESGIMAWRGAGDSAKGFGLISSSPLPGEDILVRRLADAASQAIEKGLAFKPQSTKKAEIEVSKKPVTTVVVDEIIDTTTPPPPTAEPMDVLSSFSSNEGPGPRSAGARRSSERSRGSRKVTSTTSPIQVDEEES